MIKIITEQPKILWKVRCILGEGTLWVKEHNSIYFTDIKKNETEFGKNLYEIINEIAEEYNFPVMYGFPAGHGQKNLPLILGRNVNITVSKNKSEIRFSN